MRPSCLSFLFKKKPQRTAFGPSAKRFLTVAAFTILKLKNARLKAGMAALKGALKGRSTVTAPGSRRVCGLPLCATTSARVPTLHARVRTPH